ncbi:MAG: outer membrane beta-barrel protein [Bacteroidales bacterium]
MKKRVLILSLLSALFLAPAWSQPSLRWGVKAGLTLAGLKSDSGNVGGYKVSNKGDSNVGFLVGFTSEAELGEFFLKPELYFAQSVTTVETGAIETPQKNTLNSINVPILAGVNIGSFRFGLGPVATIALNSSADFGELMEDKLEQTYNRVTFGYQLMLGTHLQSRLALDVRYEDHFSNSGAVENLAGPGKLDNRINTVMISLNYFFK